MLELQKYQRGVSKIYIFRQCWTVCARVTEENWAQGDVSDPALGGWSNQVGERGWVLAVETVWVMETERENRIFSLAMKIKCEVIPFLICI